MRRVQRASRRPRRFVLARFLDAPIDALEHLRRRPRLKLMIPRLLEDAVGGVFGEFESTGAVCSFKVLPRRAPRHARHV
jgi:hypothetical protein